MRAMRVGETHGLRTRQPRQHGVARFGSERRGRLVVEVDHACTAIDSQTSAKRSISATLVVQPVLMRIVRSARSASTSMAVSTWLRRMEPEEQALPWLTAIP